MYLHFHIDDLSQDPRFQSNLRVLLALHSFGILCNHKSKTKVYTKQKRRVKYTMCSPQFSSLQRQAKYLNNIVHPIVTPRRW